MPPNGSNGAPSAKDARRAVEKAHDVLGGSLRRELASTLAWIDAVELGHVEHVATAVETTRLARENATLRSHVGELIAANEALAYARNELCKQLEVTQRMSKGVLPSVLELERLVEDRRRLLEALGMSEYEWMARGGVYFPKPPGRK